MPALNNAKGLRVTSRAFNLLQDREKKEGRRISIDAIARDTGLAAMTIRRFVSPSKQQDVNGSSLVAAAMMADYFGVSIGDLIEVENAVEAVSEE